MSPPDLPRVKGKHVEAAEELRKTVERVLLDHEEQYAPSAAEIVRTVATRARSSLGMEPCDLADVSEATRAEYLTAAALGLAAGQTEVALSLAPRREQTHPYMHLVVTMSSMGFDDAVCRYLVRAGHYVARRRLACDGPAHRGRRGSCPVPHATRRTPSPAG